MTYSELNKKLSISEDDLKKITLYTNKINEILKKYDYKRDTEYKDEPQMSKRDKLKELIGDFKYHLDNLDNFYV